MIKENSVLYNYKYKKYLRKKYPTDILQFIELLQYVNPVYDYFIENANTASYKLIKAFMTNIVPLGYYGKEYFKQIVDKKRGIDAELWKFFNQLEHQYWEDKLEISTYSELMNLGYNGEHLGGEHPVDDILKYIGEEAIKNAEAICK